MVRDRFSDLLAEIWVGRVCVDSFDEMSNYVGKILRYEKEDDPYLKKVLLLGEKIGFPGVSYWGGNYKDLFEQYIPPDYNVTKLYDRDYNESPYFWVRRILVEILNMETPHIINHLGHGNAFWGLRMNPDSILSLTNDKYFF